MSEDTNGERARFDHIFIGGVFAGYLLHAWKMGAEYLPEALRYIAVASALAVILSFRFGSPNDPLVFSESLDDDNASTDDDGGGST